MRRISTALVMLMLINAVASYLREVIVAALFGASAATDAYFSAYILVTAACDLLLGSALLTSCIPVFAPLAQAGQSTLRERVQLVASAAAAVAAFGTVLAVLLWLALPILLAIVAPGFDAAARSAARSMASIMVWLVPTNALLALFVGILNSHRRLIGAALAGFTINGGFILAVLVLSPSLGPFALPVASLLAPAATVAMLALWLYRIGLLRLVPLAFDIPSARLFWHLARPTLLTVGLGTSAGLLTVSQLLIRSFGSYHGEGAISALAYAFRIYEFPITLVANTATPILLPLIAQLHARGEGARVAEVCRSALLWGTLLLFPGVVAAAVAPELLVQLLLRYGRLTAVNASLTAEALRGFSPAVLFEAVCLFAFQIFYAIRRPRVPLVLSLVSICTTLGLLWVTRGQGGLATVSLCMSASFVLTCVGAGAFILRAYGRSALPENPRLFGILVSGGLALAVWRALESAAGGPAIGLVGGLAAYVIGVFVFLPDDRRSFAALLLPSKIWRVD